MATPQHVKQQAEKADALHQQVYQQIEGEAASEDEVIESEATEIVAEADAAEGAPEAATPEKAAEAEPEAEEGNFEAETAESEAQEEDSAPAPSKDKQWEHRYNTLMGRNEALNRRVRSLETLLASLEAATAAEKAEPEAGTSAAERFLTESDIEDYGEELIDVVKRAAREEVSPYIKKIAELEQENGKLRNALGGVSQSMAKSARDAVYESLHQHVPNWETINKDPIFLEWLGEVDVYAGKERRAMLQEAFEKNDAARVVRFFEGFLSERTSVDQEHHAPPTERSPQASLDQMVAPGRPRGAGNMAGAQDSKKMWTQQDVRQFYADVQRGKYKGREKDRNRIERDIIEASREGRIAA